MKSKGPASESKYQALIELLRTAETLWNASRIFFARWDLSPSQFNVLNLLHEQPEGCTQVELSRQLIMHRSNVTGLVDRLEDRGFVRREGLPQDRRSINVRLTDTGKKLIRQIEPHYHRAAESVWNGTSSDGIRQLMRQLQVISDNAERTAKSMAKTELRTVSDRVTNKINL